MEIIRPTQNEIVTYIRSDAERLTQKLEDDRNSPGNKFIASFDIDAHYYDEKQRCLSEMPVCLGLRDTYPPKGLRLARDYITYIRDNVKDRQRHMYYLSEEGVICCLTFGQFILAKEVPGSYPGYRIEIARQLAPDLVHKITGDISALVGTRSQIRTALNIDYPD